MQPLIEVRAAGHMTGIALPALRKNGQCEEKICGTQGCRYKPRRGKAKAMITRASDGRAEYESKPEGHSYQSHFLGALFRRGNIRNICLRHGNVSTTQTREHS